MNSVVYGVHFVILVAPHHAVHTQQGVVLKTHMGTLTPMFLTLHE